MSEFKGKKLNVTVWGESHSAEIGATVSGMPKTEVDLGEITEFMQMRKPTYSFSTARKEGDAFEVEGLKDGFFEGNFSVTIKNNDVNGTDYADLVGKPRPSHADYVRFAKEGTTDFSGGGRFSGRLTAPLCVVGSVCKQYLKARGVQITAYVSQVGSVCGKSYKDGKITAQTAEKERTGAFPSLSNWEEMIAEAEKAAEQGNSVGGKIECVVSGLPAGVGNDSFDGLEGKISALLYAIPAVKGVEFGLGFGFAGAKGSDVNDQLFSEDGKIRFSSNNSGGINGGVSNGDDITLGVAFRPTPSISLPQKTVDLATGENVEIKIGGRHDACIVPRAVPCVESAVAIALVDEFGE